VIFGGVIVKRLRNREIFLDKKVVIFCEEKMITFCGKNENFLCGKMRIFTMKLFVDMCRYILKWSGIKREYFWSVTERQFVKNKTKN
jgi:hypothetical protein